MLSLLLILVFFFSSSDKAELCKRTKDSKWKWSDTIFWRFFQPICIKKPWFTHTHWHTYVCSSSHALFALTNRRIFFRLASIYTYSSPSHHFMQALVIAYTNFLINKWRNQEMLTPHPHNYRKWGKKINASQLLLNWKNQYHELIYYQ